MVLVGAGGAKNLGAALGEKTEAILADMPERSAERPRLRPPRAPAAAAPASPRPPPPPPPAFAPSASQLADLEQTLVEAQAQQLETTLHQAHVEHAAARRASF